MTIQELIGQDVYDKLLESAADKGGVILDAENVIEYCKRDVSLKDHVSINVLIAMVKSAAISTNPHPSKVSGEAERIIKSLRVDEATRIRLYEELFDREGIYKAGSVICRR
jgi:hypothetical protein